MRILAWSSFGYWWTATCGTNSHLIANSVWGWPIYFLSHLLAFLALFHFILFMAPFLHSFHHFSVSREGTETKRWRKSQSGWDYWDWGPELSHTGIYMYRRFFQANVECGLDFLQKSFHPGEFHVLVTLKYIVLYRLSVSLLLLPSWVPERVSFLWSVLCCFY